MTTHPTDRHPASGVRRSEEGHMVPNAVLADSPTRRLADPSTVVLVPVRSFRTGKTRLANALSPDERNALIRRMLLRVIRSALDSSTVDAVLVVSPDEAALTLSSAEDPRVVALAQDPEQPGLNGAIAQGQEWAKAQGASALLILFGDLPLLEPSDVQHIVRRDAPVVIAPDRHGTGTNALLIRLAQTDPDAPPFQFHFGLDSYAHHVDEAHRLGLEVATSLTPGTAFDLDTPEDLALLEVGGSASRQVGGDETAGHEIADHGDNRRQGDAPCSPVSESHIGVTDHDRSLRLGAIRP